MNKDQKITPVDIANYFIGFANMTGDYVTNLKLQKLVYYAQAWYLANFGKPLFEEDFEAWVHGPVIPSLYRKYKKYGSSPIIEDIDLTKIKSKFNADVVLLLDEVIKVYMPAGGYQLEQMTHVESPWIKARGKTLPDAKSEKVISKRSMKLYYGEKINKAY